MASITHLFSDVSGKGIDSNSTSVTLFDLDKTIKGYNGEEIDMSLAEKKEFKKLVQNFVKNKKLDW